MCAGSVKQDGSASRETKAWAILLQGCLDRRELNSACAGQKIAQSESLDDWTEEEEVDVSEEEDNTQCTYKLQILYATDLVGADSNLFKRSEETSSDPFCIVLFDGTEVARSAVTHHSLNPIFRAASIEKRAGCFVDVPYEMVFGASTQRESFEYILQVYDYDKVGRGDFLGEVRLSRSDLRDAVGRRVSKALQPAVGGTRNENRFVGGHLHFAAHLLPAETRIELHVVEANDLALPISQVVKASSKQNALLRLGARAIDSVKESLEPSLNPFAICYAGFAVSKFILFLTLNGVRAVEWQRGGTDHCSDADCSSKLVR